MISDENLKQLREMMAALLEEYGFKKPDVLSAEAAAVRMRRYRERQRNASVTGRNEKRNRTQSEKRNGVRNQSVTDASPITITVPLIDGTEFGVTEKMAAHFAELYPAVDVPQTLREIKGWNYARPKQRKTRDGILKHINGWLAKEQNKG